MQGIMGSCYIESVLTREVISLRAYHFSVPLSFREVITATEHFQTIAGHGLEKTGIFVSHPILWPTINYPKKQCKITNAYREKVIK